MQGEIKSVNLNLVWDQGSKEAEGYAGVDDEQASRARDG